MATAFVLSGGASLGAVQVGMLQALDEQGIRPDLIVGASVGALNGAFVAGRPGAIPAVFPPVRIGERCLMDGGISNNTPISHAVQLGATTVYALPTGFPCALKQPPTTALGMGLHALTLLFGQRLALDIERYENRCDLHVVPPPCPIAVSPANFTRSAELIRAAHDAAAQWLASGRPRPPGGQSERVVAHHHHIPATGRPS